MKRTFVVGDIHGCFDELIELTQKVGLKDSDQLISVGDIVDRGGKSKEAYEFFKNRPNTRVLVGNHERKHLNGVLSYAQEIVKLQMGSEYPQFLQWISTLEYYYETPEAIIVHAAFEHDKALKEQREEVLCGATAGERFLEKKYGTEIHWNDAYRGDKPIIYGHHVVGPQPKISNNTYGIDTGCCHDGYLTAIELPGFIIHQVKAKRDYWKEEQRKWQIPVLKSKDWMNMELDAIKKQQAKLSFLEGEAKDFLSSLDNWLSQVERLRDVAIKPALDLFTQNLVSLHKEDFNTVANNYPFKTFLFKSRSNSLKLDDVQKTLNTPGKIITLAKTLNIQEIPNL